MDQIFLRNFMKRLRIEDPARIPGNIDELCANSLVADYPIIAGAGSTYGRLRNWMGVERISEAIIDEPEWVEEMLEHLKRLHDATNEDVKQLRAKLDKKDAEVEILIAQLNGAQENVLQQKVLTAKYIADAEAYKVSLEAEIVELRKKLAEANGDNN